MNKIFLSILTAVFALGIIGASTAWAQETAPGEPEMKTARLNKQWRQNCQDAPARGQNQVPPEERGALRDQALEKRAQILGIVIEELRAQLKQGKKFSEIAQEKGISPEQMREQVMEQNREQMRERINQLVEQGKITQEQAQKRLGQLDKKMEQRQQKPKPKFQWLKNLVGNLGRHWGQR